MFDRDILLGVCISKGEYSGGIVREIFRDGWGSFPAPIYIYIIIYLIMNGQTGSGILIKNYYFFNFAPRISD